MISQPIARDQEHVEYIVVNWGEESDRPPIGDYGSAHPLQYAKVIGHAYSGKAAALVEQLLIGRSQILKKCDETNKQNCEEKKKRRTSARSRGRNTIF